MNLCLSRSKWIYVFKGVEMYLLSVNASKLNLSPEETLVNCSPTAFSPVCCLSLLCAGSSLKFITQILQQYWFFPNPAKKKKKHITVLSMEKHRVDISSHRSPICCIDIQTQSARSASSLLQLKLFYSPCVHERALWNIAQLSFTWPSENGLCVSHL